MLKIGTQRRRTQKQVKKDKEKLQQKLIELEQWDQIPLTKKEIEKQLEEANHMKELIGQLLETGALKQDPQTGVILAADQNK